jgi:ferredoxin
MRPGFVAEDSLGATLAALLAGRRVYAVKDVQGKGRLVPCDAAQATPAPFRSVEPVKALFFRPRHDLGGYLGGPTLPEEPAPQQRAVVGLKACDLAALKVLDHVFLEGAFEDPDYRARREATLLVSTDCSQPLDVCFCTFLEGRPYPEQGHDLNLSAVSGGYVVEAGSEAGRGLMRAQGAEVQQATDAQLRERDSRRAAAARQVAEAVHAGRLGPLEGLSERVRLSAEHPVWRALAEKCVECGACNLICPTCHCFLLKDLEERHGFRRFQNWDACLYPAFAREASGANPRPRRAQRLQGRLEKKCDFIKADSGRWGCVGCGRCIEACAGGIDVRETFKELAYA